MHLYTKILVDWAYGVSTVFQIFWESGLVG